MDETVIENYLGLDVETGGIETDKSLLTAYFEVFDANFQTLAELDLKIRHDVYSVTAEAMEINKIDLLLHHKEAEYQKTAGNKLLKLLQKFSDNGKNKLVPVGHGIAFDFGFIFQQLLGRKTFEAYTSYRKIDTSSIAQFLKRQGKLPAYVTGSVGSLAGYYDIPLVQENRMNASFHTARFDTKATIQIFQAQLKS